MKIERRKIWPIGRSRLALIAVIQAESDLRMQRGAESDAGDERNEQLGMELHAPKIVIM